MIIGFSLFSIEGNITERNGNYAREGYENLTITYAFDITKNYS